MSVAGWERLGGAASVLDIAASGSSLSVRDSIRVSFNAGLLLTFLLLSYGFQASWGSPDKTLYTTCTTNKDKRSAASEIWTAAIRDLVMISGEPAHKLQRQFVGSL
jgi:hypothetical protein